MSTVILVLDGFGLGAMPDAGRDRPKDADADTLGTLARWAAESKNGGMRIPHLAALGLKALRPDLSLPSSAPVSSSVARMSALGYPGADSFAGHQTMMGADMSHVALCRLGERIDDVRSVLDAAGHCTRLLDGWPVIVVDEHMLVHDNLEADPGLNWNVSAPLDIVPWEVLLDAAQTVRSVAPVARVIAVGGYSDRPLSASVREGDLGVVGLDTPESGFYRNHGLKVQHLGATVDYHRQLPEAAARAGLRVALVGKAADILQSQQELIRCPAVETHEVLDYTVAAAAESGLVVANVQQTDLAGHQQDPAAFVHLLEMVDERIPILLSAMHRDDLLVITADHGNDPLVGHAYHTREHVPVLAIKPSGPAVAAQRGSDLGSLADVGAGVARFLNLGEQLLANGCPVDLTRPAADRD